MKRDVYYRKEWFNLQLEIVELTNYYSDRMKKENIFLICPLSWYRKFRLPCSLNGVLALFPGANYFLRQFRSLLSEIQLLKYHTSFRHFASAQLPRSIILCIFDRINQLCQLFFYRISFFIYTLFAHKPFTKLKDLPLIKLSSISERVKIQRVQPTWG